MNNPKFPKYPPGTVVCYEDIENDRYVFTTVIGSAYFPREDRMIYTLDIGTCQRFGEDDLVSRADFHKTYYRDNPNFGNL